MQKLTDKQKAVFSFILEYQKVHGFPPTMSDVKEHFGFASLTTVRGYLHTLQRKGMIRVHPGKVRGIEIIKGQVESGIPLVGQIPAGFPDEAIEDFEEILPVDPEFFGFGTKFALRVKGDSMIGAGIRDGDIAVIRKQATCEDGEIVAVLVDDEATLKRFKKRSNGVIELLSENPKYEPLVFKPPDSPVILGVYVGLIRRLR